MTAAGVEGPAAPAAVAPEPSDLSKGLSDESRTPLLRVLLSAEGVEAEGLLAKLLRIYPEALYSCVFVASDD